MTNQETQPANSPMSNGIDQLEYRLQGKLTGLIRELKLLRTNDGIIVQGIARSHYTKQLVTHAVIQQTNLPIVRNEIIVSEPS